MQALRSTTPAAPIPVSEDSPRVLVIDDEVNVRQAIVRVLSNAGYKVLSANDGDEALRLLDRESVDLIVTDLAMPNTDGMTVLRTVRERNLELPV
ncbi:MAG: response regulator, partial [Polyangiales bacterium]